MQQVMKVYSDKILMSDLKAKELVEKKGWSRKQKRAFGRMLSGVIYHTSRGFDIGDFKHLILTTDGKGKFVNDMRALQVHFEALIKRIRRKYGHETFRSRRVFVYDPAINYNGIDYRCPKCFASFGTVDDFKTHTSTHSELSGIYKSRSGVEYFAIKTKDEGFGVIHCLIRCPDIDKEWLNSAWKDLHDSFITKIIRCYGTPKKLIAYLCGRYLIHEHEWNRFQTSMKWVFRGVCGFMKDTWNIIKHHYGYEYGLGRLKRIIKPLLFHEIKNTWMYDWKNFLRGEPAFYSEWLGYE